MPAASLRALLARSIDYAGMFPPCSLALEPALQNYGNYIHESDAWMLSNFILPATQFAGVSAAVAQFDRKHPLRVSALGSRTETIAAFRPTFQEAMEVIRKFSAEHAGVVSIDQFEMLLPADVDLATLAEAAAMFGEMKLHVFWEAPADTAENAIALLAQHNSRKNTRVFGYKLRTGGVTADAFPSAAQIGGVLIAAARNRVPIKFTAGLHHPIRQFRDEVKTKMHGFLNVLGAGVLAAEHDWDEGQISRMLEDENADSFTFDETIFAWREWEIAIDRIHARRKLITSFGSCSFDEPREDLRALNLL
jgi:hypothetical protein